MRNFLATVSSPLDLLDSIASQTGQDILALGEKCPLQISLGREVPLARQGGAG